MLIREETITVTCAGAAGTSVGSIPSTNLMGLLMATAVEYTSCPATTDILVTEMATGYTLLSIPNAATNIEWSTLLWVLNGTYILNVTGANNGSVVKLRLRYQC